LQVVERNLQLPLSPRIIVMAISWKVDRRRLCAQDQFFAGTDGAGKPGKGSS
jgi:hypothetical protein